MDQNAIYSPMEFVLVQLHDNLGKYCRASQECALSACSSVGKSPFPALDKFVECIASTGNDPGTVMSTYGYVCGR